MNVKTLFEEIIFIVCFFRALPPIEAPSNGVVANGTAQVLDGYLIGIVVNFDKYISTKFSLSWFLIPLSYRFAANLQKYLSAKFSVTWFVPPGCPESGRDEDARWRNKEEEEQVGRFDNVENADLKCCIHNIKNGCMSTFTKVLYFVSFKGWRGKRLCSRRRGPDLL